jgi:tricorn protease
VTSPGYLQYPHINGDLVTFVAADDVWLAPAAGGRAWRFTADLAPVMTPRFAPDGTHVAWVSGRDGGADVYLASVANGATTRLSYWGESAARVSCWTASGEVVAVSNAAQPFRQYSWARALGTPLSGGEGAERLLPFGPLADVSLAAGALEGVLGLLNGRSGSGRDPAHWKRYRGGTAGRLWLGSVGGGNAARFRRVLADLPGQFASPMMAGGRFAFLSDHEGTGNVYSCALDGTGLRRHTDHDGFYARQASTDGQRIIYVCCGELWVLDDLAAGAPRRLDIVLGSPAAGRSPRLVSAADHVGSLSVDSAGTASAVEVRGTVHWLTHRDGPATALAVTPGVRARHPQVLGTDGGAVWVTDADGADALEVREGNAGDSTASGAVARPLRRLAAGQLGRISGLAAAPDGSVVAVAGQDGRLQLVDVASGQVRLVTTSANGRMTGLAFSPDSAWLAWSQPTDHPGGMGEQPLRSLRLARVADGAVSDVTDGRFIDTDPVFTLDGRFLAFLSRRSFDPIYDAHFFDLSFPYGARPYLVPLAAATPSPFAPQPGGRPIGDIKPRRRGEDGEDRDDNGEPPEAPSSVDPDRMADRVVALPVPESRYSRLRAVKGGLAWLREPVTGNLGVGGARPTDDAPLPVLERFDLAGRECTALADEVEWFAASGDGTRLVVSAHGKLTVIPAERKADDNNPDDHVEVDASRARFQCDPVAMWRPAYAEAIRIMRHDFWVADMADVDWDAIAAEYLPLLDRITTAAEFADVLWEVFGELGTSHAYVAGPDGGSEADQQQGLLGTDLERTDDGWRISEVLRGETSDPRARSPLAGPGVGVGAGDFLLAIDGRPVGPDGPGSLLAGTADKPVELTVAAQDGSRRRSVVVVPLGSDRRLRYLDWVRRKRAAVRELSGGQIGYLHVPDMVSEGWADFHRDLRTEMLRDALIIDVRCNTGGHTSQLVVEKLARRIIGWDVPRGLAPATYPEDALRGPMVALADECSGSDGDIVTAAIKVLGLGPVVGARTWGGVVGYDEPHELADGTQLTVPRLAFWFDAFGWAVENHGVDPDVEVIPTPDDWASGRDVQLETAVQLALAALRDQPAVRPPDPASRPSRRRPALPPR